MPELVLKLGAGHVVAGAERAVVIHEVFRDEEQRQPLRSRRRIRQAREHHVDDVLRHRVLAVSNKNLRSGDFIAAIARRHGTRPYETQVGACLRLGKLHGARPFAGHELWQIFALQFRRAVRDDGMHARLSEKRIEPVGHVRAVPNLGQRHGQRERKPLPSILARHGHTSPSAGNPLAIGFPEAIRHDDLAIHKPRALLVARAIGRSKLLVRKPRRLFQDRHRGIHVEILEQAAFDKLRESGDMIEREGDVRDRRAIGH